MTYVCNDQLTLVRPPSFGKDWTVPKTYRVGDHGVKNGTPYIVRAFGVSRYRRDGFSPIVWLVVKWRGHRGWLELLIGQEDCFAEKLVRGRHCNPVFNR